MAINVICLAKKMCVNLFQRTYEWKREKLKVRILFLRGTAQQCKELDGGGSILFDKSCWCTKYGRLISISGLGMGMGGGQLVDPA